MNSWSTLITLTTAIIIFLPFIGCSPIIDDDDKILKTIEEAIKKGDPIPDYGDIKIDTLVPDIITLENEDRENMRWVCKPFRVSLTGGGNSFQLFNTNAEVIYPGNLLQWKSLSEGTPAPIVVKRAGGTISYNLNEGIGSFTVEEVKKSTIQSAMNSIIANSSGVVPANFKLEIEEVQSQEELAASLGISFQNFTTSIGNNMTFSREKSYNRFLVKLTQQYYTMSFDLPTSLEDIFHPVVTAEQLATYIQQDNPGTFISSVTYGRVFHMLVESTASRQDMRASLQASYKSIAGKIEGEIDINSFKSLENVKIKVIAYGGDAEGTFQILGESTVENIADKIAKSTDIKAGLPLSYVVRSLEDPSQIVQTNLATEYTIKNCELKGELPPIGYRPFLDLFEDGIGAMVNISGTNILIFNKNGDEYVWYNGNLGEILGNFSISDTNAPLGKLSFTKIGAAVRYEENRIYLFDETGLKYQVVDYDSNLYNDVGLPNGPIGELNQQVYLVNEYFGRQKNYPFFNIGVEAAIALLPLKRIRFDIGGDYEAAQVYFFGKPGNEYAFYQKFKFNNIDSEEWSGSRSTKGLFSDQDIEFVDAATMLFKDGGNGLIYLYVNDIGDNLIVFDSAIGEWKVWIIR